MIYFFLEPQTFIFLGPYFCDLKYRKSFKLIIYKAILRFWRLAVHRAEILSILVQEALKTDVPMSSYDVFWLYDDFVWILIFDCFSVLR